MKETVYFMHIPKTAGTSVSTVFDLNFSPHKIFQVSFPAKEYLALFNILPQKTKDNLELIKGHFPFGIHKLVNTEPKYVTFLRDPISRALSDFNYRCNSHWLDFYEEFKANDYTFDFYLKKIHRSNLQTRFFAGYGHIKELDIDEDKLFEIATQNLQKYFKFVGFTEHFNDSILALSNYLGFKYVHFWKENKTENKQKEKFTDSEIEIIKKINSKDIQIYNLAKDLFLEKINSPKNQFRPIILKKTKKLTQLLPRRAIKKFNHIYLKFRYKPKKINAGLK